MCLKGMKGNTIWFAEKQIIFNEKIAEIVEFEKCVVIRNKYSNENPTNNLVAFDFMEINYGKLMISLSLWHLKLLFQLEKKIASV